MDHCAEKRRLNTEYVQAVLDSGKSLDAGHVLAVGSAADRRYWVLDPDRKPLGPPVPRAALAAPNPRVRNRTALEGRYAEVLAFHRRVSSDEDPQRELIYRPARVRGEVRLSPQHMGFLRDLEDRQKDRDEGLSR